MKTSKLAVYSLVALSLSAGFTSSIAQVATCNLQKQSFTPPHKKNRRGKHKRSGK